MIPFPDKKYNVIYADPPWTVKAGPGWNPNGKSRELEYPTMTIDEISNMPVKQIAEDNAVLFIWTINKYLGETFGIIKQWGFKYSMTLVWCKPPNGGGLGGVFSPTTEFLLFARRGSLKGMLRHDTTWWNLKRGRHSKKPDHFIAMIESTFPGNKIELFSRERKLTWDVWGNEV